MGKQIKKVWFWVEEHFLILLVLIMGMDILLQIISRRVFNEPLSFTEELARHLQIWVTFLGAGLCFRRGEMIRATFVYDKMPRTVQYMMDIVSYLFMLWVTAMLFSPAMEMVRDQAVISWDTIPQLKLSLVYICEPIGFAVISLYILVKLVATVLEMVHYLKTKEEKA